MGFQFFEYMWYHLYNLKNVKKHPWKSVTFSLKATLPHGCFSRFLNSTNGTQLHKAPHIKNNITAAQN